MKWFGIAYNIQMARWDIHTIVWKPETWDLRLAMTCHDKFLRWHHYFQGSTHHPHKQYLVNITCTIVAKQWQQRTYFFPIN